MALNRSAVDANGAGLPLNITIHVLCLPLRSFHLPNTNNCNIAKLKRELTAHLSLPGVVECMAAGLVTIAHRSGGPLADIVETSLPSRTGFLAVEAEEYARAVLEVIALRPDERRAIVDAAR